jgi:hypothetical protein
MLLKRIERLVVWRDGVNIYIKDNETIPKNLYDVTTTLSILMLWI